jgi:guanine deaminase
MHEPFIRRAIDLAVENVRSGRGGPFGALVVKDGEVLAEGVNQVTTACDPTAHAEMQAIRAACARLKRFDLRGCELYSSCEPCPMCLSAIYWARLDRLYYAATRDDAARAGFDDSRIYDEIPRAVEERQLPMRQVLGGEDARRPFSAWMAHEARVAY